MPHITSQPKIETNFPRIATFGVVTRLLGVIFLFLSVISPTLADDALPLFPRFRHIDHSLKAQPPKPKDKITLLTEQDFAPWSFPGANKEMKGISVDLALAACAQAGLTCTVKAAPFADLLPALLRGEGDVVISGLRIDETIAGQTGVTRPYFVSLGRFLTRMGSAVTAADIRSLAGRRIGYVKGTSHGAFIEREYPRSVLTPFGDTTTMLEALRTGSLDVAFGDSISLAYWLNSAASRNCCMPLGKTFVSRDTFSRNLVFLARRDGRDLKAIFDNALDQLEEKGETARIFTSYLPGPVW